MKQNVSLPALELVLLVLLTLAGCSSRPQLSGAMVSGPRVQPLPLAARQPPTPQFCQPTCSERLSSDFETWRARLTGAAPPAGSASQATTQ